MKKYYLVAITVLLISTLSFAQALTPWMGIHIEKVDTGVKVLKSVIDTPAFKAGLKEGDIIQQIDTDKVKTPEELIQKIQAKGVGHDVVVHYLKDGKTLTKLTLSLEAKPGMLELAKRNLLNKNAPNFKAKVFSKDNKQLFELDKNKGKPTIIEFWATWCGACMQAHPIVSKFAKEYEGKINLLSISDEAPKKIRKFLHHAKKKGIVNNTIKFLQGAETTIQKDYFVPALPMFLVLDKDNKVVFVTIGTGKNLTQVFDKAKSLL